MQSNLDDERRNTNNKPKSSTELMPFLYCWVEISMFCCCCCCFYCKFAIKFFVSFSLLKEFMHLKLLLQLISIIIWSEIVEIGWFWQIFRTYCQLSNDIIWKWNQTIKETTSTTKWIIKMLHHSSKVKLETALENWI